jgi:hypothetical protein
LLRSTLIDPPRGVPCSLGWTAKVDRIDIRLHPPRLGDEARLDRVNALVEDDRDCCGCRLGGECRGGAGDRDNYGHLTTNQISR